MINNFELIKPLLKFPNDDIYYHLQILRRGKDPPELPAANRVIKAYFICSLESLDYVEREIKDLCSLFGARAYINLAPKSIKKTTMFQLKYLAERVYIGDFKKIWKSWNTCAGEIKEKFGIADNKTINPPKTLNIFSENLYVSLIAGFIDGDGNIQNPTNRKDFFLRIKNHSSWLHILQEFNNYIYPEKDCCKINSSGYAELIITNTVPLQKLKEKVVSLNLPILNRKWDKIDLNFVSRYTKADEDRQKVIDLYLQNYKVKDICNTLNLKEGKVYKIIREYKNEQI